MSGKIASLVKSIQDSKTAKVTKFLGSGLSSLIEAGGTKLGMLGLAGFTGVSTIGHEFAKQLETTDVQSREELKGLKTAVDMPGNIAIGTVIGGGLAGATGRLGGYRNPYITLGGAAIGAGLGALSAGSEFSDKGAMNFALRAKLIDPAQDMAGPEMAGAMQGKIDGPMMFGKGTPRNYSLGAKGDLTLALHHKRHG